MDILEAVVRVLLHGLFQDKGTYSRHPQGLNLALYVTEIVANTTFLGSFPPSSPSFLFLCACARACVCACVCVLGGVGVGGCVSVFPVFSDSNKLTYAVAFEYQWRKTAYCTERQSCNLITNNIVKEVFLTVF